MELFDTINNEIKKAMLAKDKIRLEALRGIKKEFLEAKTAKGAADQLTEQTAISILQKMVKQRKESAQIFSSQGRDDLVENETAQMEVIQEFLPAQLSAEEIEGHVKKIIADLGATSMKDMGKVMGTATKQLAGKADGSVISQIVRTLLA